ncbi:tripartite tricarboxylate transporter TctB family protein [Arcobacter sp. LA11]|uniref:tripartite tricarboxylate transporter TctB family protein n=1 Tax=Arcobacter sp. LA11 TaxID=1898176 RepID=UPI0009353E99|nr:tripartite tricarboxylate transporter TctB family protein [Arcobacter sp. LA11]
MSKNTIGSIFFLVFSIFYFISVFDIKKMPGAEFETMTAATFPFYVGITGILISILMIVLPIILKNKEEVSDVITMSYLKTLDFKTTSYFIAVMIFYGFTIRSLGFILSTIIFLALGFLLLKERNLKRIFLVSVGVSVGFYLILNNLLGVYIDPGFIVSYFTGGES